MNAAFFSSSVRSHQVVSQYRLRSTTQSGGIGASTFAGSAPRSARPFARAIDSSASRSASVTRRATSTSSPYLPTWSSSAGVEAGVTGGLGRHHVQVHPVRRAGVRRADAVLDGGRLGVAQPAVHDREEVDVAAPGSEPARRQRPVQHHRAQTRADDVDTEVREPIGGAPCALLVVIGHAVVLPGSGLPFTGSAPPGTLSAWRTRTPRRHPSGRRRRDRAHRDRHRRQPRHRAGDRRAAVRRRVARRDLRPR